MGWHVTPDAGTDAARALLNRDRAWNGYALADLEQPFRQYSRFALAAREGETPSAGCLALQHPAITVIVPQGEGEGVAAIFATIAGDLPRGAELSVRAGHRQIVERYYAPRPGLHEMLRMHTDAAAFHPPVASPPRPRALGRADAAALFDLYAGYDENVFREELLDGGCFFGVEADGRLLAAGGTHVVCPGEGAGAVGNIFTRPEARGRGLARAVTAAVTAALLAKGCRDVVLNVRADNAPAIHVYAALGYREHCRFWEGWAERRPLG
ncbi:MAG TPA: GNAT family N-acetyltransferase [Dehalococcoidia bacterium]|nr:GNAT family N-acetyltransferase [Dehalococcoidia bacterium]